METVAIPDAVRSIADRSRRIACILLLAAAAIPSAPTFAAAGDKGGPYVPTPWRQRSVATAGEAADERTVAPEQDGRRLGDAESRAHEREALRALGFDPDDPLAASALRAETSRAPAQATAAGDFFPDPAWGTGGYAYDRSEWGNPGIYRGLAAVTLANGDVVTVGAVNLPLGYVGITRRDASGRLVAWPDVTPPYNGGDGRYLLWRGVNSWDRCPMIVGALDLKLRSDRLWILVNCYDLETVVTRLLVFSVNGGYDGALPVAFDTPSPTRLAVAMDLADDRLLVLGRYQPGTSGGFWTAMLGIGGGPLTQSLGHFPAPGGYDRSEPVDVAFRKSGILGGGNGDYYVLFTRKWSADANDQDFDPCLLAAKANHALDTAFPGSSGGVRCRAFDEPGSRSADKAVALEVGSYLDLSGGIPVQRERMHVLVDVARSVEDGFGLWALRNRSDDAGFGPGGRRVFGGCAAGDACAEPFGVRRTHAPTHLAYLGTDIAVVGSESGRSLLGATYRYPMLARLRAVDGTLRQLASFRTGHGDGQFNTLAVRDEKRVVGIGEAMDDEAGAPSARVQIAIGLTGDDTIFRNGFDG